MRATSSAASHRLLDNWPLVFIFESFYFSAGASTTLQLGANKNTRLQLVARLGVCGRIDASREARWGRFLSQLVSFHAVRMRNRRPRAANYLFDDEVH